jgi:hypothetical protein
MSDVRESPSHRGQATDSSQLLVVGPLLLLFRLFLLDKQRTSILRSSSYASSTLPLVEPKPEAVACCWCRGPAPAPPTAFVAAGCCCGRRWRRGGADGGALVALRGRLFRPPRPAPPCPPWATALRPRASRCPAAPRPAARGRRTSRCPRRRSWGGPSTRCPPLALPPLRCAPSVRQSPSPYPARNRH